MVQPTLLGPQAHLSDVYLCLDLDKILWPMFPQGNATGSDLGRALRTETSPRAAAAAASCKHFCKEIGCNGCGQLAEGLKPTML